MRAPARSLLLLGSLFVTATVSAHGARVPARASRAPSVARVSAKPRGASTPRLAPPGRVVSPVRTTSTTRATSTASVASAATFSRNRSGDGCDRVNEQAGDGVSLRTHRIVRGDSLSAIAVLYGTSVQALTAANSLSHDAVIRIGQELLVPQQARPGGGNDWLKYARAPEKAGTVTLIAYNTQYRGQVLEKGRVTPAARSAISALLGVKGSRPPVPERLLRLVVRVSDTFGGRPIRVVSGYRSSSYFSDSRHKHSAAVDFSIPGIPNAVLRQYLLLFDDAGVGYYPNSSFVHLDVRDCAIQWTDFAGPGQAPRQRPFTPRYAQGSKLAKTSRMASELNELDEIADNAAAELAEAAPERDAPTLREATLPRGDAPAPKNAVAELMPLERALSTPPADKPSDPDPALSRESARAAPR